MRLPSFPALLALTLLPIAASAQLDDGVAAGIKAQIQKQKDAAREQPLPAPAAEAPAAAADPWAPFAASLETKYSVKLRKRVLRCPCIVYGVTKDDKPVGSLYSKLLTAPPEVVQVKLESELRALLSMEPLPAPAAPATGGISVEISGDASSLMKSQGMTLQGTMLYLRGKYVDLDPEGIVAWLGVKVDATDKSVLIVDSTTHDGDRESRKFTNGTQTP